MDPGNVPLRAVVCLSAYRKLTGLYNMTVLAISVNQPTQGVLGRLDVQGIAFDNGMETRQPLPQGLSLGGRTMSAMPTTTTLGLIEAFDRHGTLLARAPITRWPSGDGGPRAGLRPGAGRPLCSAPAPAH